jgi:hypothetical protein
MQVVLFVAANEPRVELAARGPDGTWVSRFFVGLEAMAPLESLDIELPLAELYAGADLDGEAGDGA